jgi:hypothetical protein
VKRPDGGNSSSPSLTGSPGRQEKEEKKIEKQRSRQSVGEIADNLSTSSDGTAEDHTGVVKSEPVACPQPPPLLPLQLIPADPLQHFLPVRDLSEGESKHEMFDPFSGKRSDLKDILQSEKRLVNEQEDFRADHVIRFQKDIMCLAIRVSGGAIHKFGVRFEKEHGLLELTAKKGEGSPEKFELSTFGECHIRLQSPVMWERHCVFPLSSMVPSV